jgi:hypothetical protein
MRTLKYNGERWYVDERSLWKRVRQWVIWIGGWEKANGKGWQFLIDYGNKKSLMSPTPISLFGHRITCYGWGWQIRIRRGCYLVSSKSGVYVSSDGAPPDVGNYPKTGFFIVRRRDRRYV